MSIESILKTALEEVRQHPQHHLKPATRRAIYEALEPLQTSAPQIHPKRGKQAILAAEKVLPIWYAVTPIYPESNEDDDTDQLPQQWADLAKNLIAGTSDIDVARQRAADDWYVSGNLGTELLEYREHENDEEFMRCDAAYYAQYSALLALNETLGIAQSGIIASFGTVTFNADGSTAYEAFDTTIIEEEPDEHLDAAGAAVKAFAMNDSAKRLEFWTWWLSEALPQVI